MVRISLDELKTDLECWIVEQRFKKALPEGSYNFETFFEWVEVDPKYSKIALDCITGEISNSEYFGETEEVLTYNVPGEAPGYTTYCSECGKELERDY